MEVDRPHAIGSLDPQPLSPDGRLAEPLALAALLQDPGGLPRSTPAAVKLAVQLPPLIEQQLMRPAQERENA